MGIQLCNCIHGALVALLPMRPACLMCGLPACLPAFLPAEYGFLSDFVKGFRVLRVLLDEYNK